MANTVIQLKKSAVPTAQPDAGSLANGELAINYADGKLFYKDSAGIVQQISGGGNTFSTINAAGTLLIADVPGDILTIDAGQNIEISSSLLLDSLTISANLTSANNWANSLASAGNAYSNTVGSAGNTYTISVGAAGNTYANNTFVKLTAPSQTITGDISISGNLFIGGNTTSVSANNLIVNDPLIYLANNNPDDILDIGFIGSYINVTSSHVHTGLFRDHSSKQYYLFQGYDGNPDINNDITPYSNNMVNATLVADLLTSNLTLGGANAIIWIKSSYDTSNGGFTTANAAFNKANAANVLAYNTGIGANSYSNSLLITAQQHTNTSTEVANNYTNTSTGAANTWANTVAAAANAYSNSLLVTARAYTNTSTAAAYAWANSVGTAGNTYASSVGTSANAYTVTVGASGNAYTNTSVSAANNFAGSMANAVNTYTTATYSTLTQLGQNWTVTNSAYSFANTVNTFAYGVAANAKGAFDKANSVTGGATISNTAPSTPAAGSLWWNTTYGRLLVYYNDGDTSQWVDATPISAAKVTMTDTAPASPLAGQLWWNNEYGRLFVYYTDEDSTSQWVDANPAQNLSAFNDLANAAFNTANNAVINSILYSLAF
jgi:hypothetical protein